MNYDMAAAELVNLTDRPPKEFEGACKLVDALFGPHPAANTEAFHRGWQDIVLDALTDTNDNYAEATARVAAALREAAYR